MLVERKAGPPCPDPVEPGKWRIQITHAPLSNGSGQALASTTQLNARSTVLPPDDRPVASARARDCRQPLRTRRGLAHSGVHKSPGRVHKAVGLRNTLPESAERSPNR